jgi:hypothetical protein
MFISPSYQDSVFPVPRSIDDKITIFEDRIFGWKLDIADQLVNGKIGPDGSQELSPTLHAGYAALDIVFSYFEMIAKYEDGYLDFGKSEHYFRQGVYSVFPAMRNYQVPAEVPGVQGIVVSLVDYVLDLMYIGVRCGLYHSGSTSGRVVLSEGFRGPFVFDPQNISLGINHRLLVPKLKEHFTSYISRLRDEGNPELRSNFDARFDFDSRV